MQNIIYSCIIIAGLTLAKLLQQTQMEAQNNNQSLGLIVQYSELSLFDQDPSSPDISYIDNQPELKYTTPLLINEELISQTVYKTAFQSEMKQHKGIYNFILTNYRLILQDVNPNKQKKQHQLISNNLNHIPPISIPYGYIQQIDIINKAFIIKLKTGLMLKIKPFAEINNVYEILVVGCTSIPYFPKTKRQQEDALCYDCLAEVERMRIIWKKYIVIPNVNGILISSYPKYFIIPKGVSQDLLKECIKARNTGRVPVLTYFSSANNTSLWRASRTKVNQQNNKFNTTYLREIDKNIVIMDLFDETNPLKYEQKIEIKLSKQFQSLFNLEIIFKKIIISYAKNQNVLKCFSKWFQEVNNLIHFSYLAIDYLKNGKSVLIQQYVDVDRASQVSAIAQIIIDPFYRTIQGFHLLIQKQFNSFGHPFSKRLGFQKQKKNETSPIFIQFLQCVHQLIVSHPKSFEFSSFYLAKIAYELFTTKYNNFYYNSHKDRLNSKFTNKTFRIQKNIFMRKQYYNYQWIQTEAIKPLNQVRKAPSLKQFLIWQQFFDMITMMRAEYSQEKQNKKRKNSIYNAIHKRILVQSG